MKQFYHIFALIGILFSSLLLFRCRPYIDTTYKNNLCEFYYYLKQDTLYIYGGYHPRIIATKPYRNPWGHRERRDVTIKIKNKRLYKTKDPKLIVRLLNERGAACVYLDRYNYIAIDKEKLPKSIYRNKNNFTVLNNKLYCIAGKNYTDSIFSDIWENTTQNNWEKVDAKLSFLKNGERTNAIMCEFKDCLVLGGGQSNYKPLTDLWTSNDIKNWQKIKDFSEAETIKNIFSYKEKLYVVTSADRRADYLYVTTDLKSWEKHEHFSFPANNNFRFFTYNNQLYASTDFGIWEYENDSTWIEFSNTNAFKNEVTVHKNMLYNQNWGRLQYSRDAKNWFWYDNNENSEDYALDTSDFSLGHYKDDYCYIEHRDTLFLFNGLEGLSQYTTDGINWEKCAKSNSIFAPRKNYAAASFNNKLWIFAGEHMLKNKKKEANWVRLKDAWYTTDGKNWIQADDLPMPARCSLKVAVLNNRMYLIGGSNYFEIWSTKNGVNWKLQDYLPRQSNQRKSIQLIPDKISPFVLMNRINIFPSDYLENGFYIYRPGSVSEFKYLDQDKKNSCYYWENIIAIKKKDSNQENYYLSKYGRRLFISSDLTKWKNIEYQFLTEPDKQFNINGARLINYKGKLLFVCLQKSQLNSYDINIK